MFSYKAQVDDAMDEDTVSLPHQQSFSSLKTDSDYIYQVHTPSIHMPLYDSQASSKSSKQGASSLHSLTSARGRKSSYATSNDSRVALCRSTSGVRRFDRPASTEKGISELIHYPLVKSNGLPVVQKSVPDLRNPSRECSSPHSIEHFKYHAAGSMSNFFLPNDTASNFLYKPRTNDSNVNLFSQTRKNSLETFNKTVTVYGMPEKVSRRHSSCLEAPIPALENTLQSILDSGTFEIKPENRMSNVERLGKESVAGAGPSHAEFLLKTRSDDTFSGRHDIANVAQQLLPASTFSCVIGAKRKNRNDSKGSEQGGLSDYLLSITSPKIRKLSRNDGSQLLDSFRDSRTQTESL